jgi:hypothetical protein
MDGNVNGGISAKYAYCLMVLNWKSVYILNQISKDYNLKISTDKTKIMAFKGKHLVRSKIEIDGSILEQVKQFNYLGCELGLGSEPDFDPHPPKKINK